MCLISLLTLTSLPYSALRVDTYQGLRSRTQEVRRRSYDNGITHVAGATCVMLGHVFTSYIQLLGYDNGITHVAGATCVMLGHVFTSYIQLLGYDNGITHVAGATCVMLGHVFTSYIQLLGYDNGITHVAGATCVMLGHVFTSYIQLLGYDNGITHVAGATCVMLGHVFTSYIQLLGLFATCYLPGHARSILTDFMALTGYDNGITHVAPATCVMLGLYFLPDLLPLVSCSLRAFISTPYSRDFYQQEYVFFLTIRPDGIEEKKNVNYIYEAILIPVVHDILGPEKYRVVLRSIVLWIRIL
ncbi:hypothetical protein L211DRAFT_880687 [Terfezia boudieri ATCC MYA-4762]|uniref:Uncharacterized protein n=1 Tax=Terfezia boudieri ATCC MYA-4762 TaxID=1051890 RepID=A0A3N4L592_9PEZI|nr:hypothetical protein L211DRAFT_880687 [Terfezia boudieri ATCC MYA-4762]